MCHTFDLRNRLRISPFTLPPADLLLTKLQAIEINEKDFKDIACLLKSKNVAPNDDADSINVEYISEICARDWGIYKTLTANLKELIDYVENKLKMHQDELRSKTNAIIKNIEEKPKTIGWKMRERIGERKRWYDLPEEKRSQAPTSGQVGSEASDTGHHPEIG
jgi:polyhydroxyalkanoate synthesis regulator phasin